MPATSQAQQQQPTAPGIDWAGLAKNPWAIGGGVAALGAGAYALSGDEKKKDR